MNNEITERCIIDAFQKLKIFTYDEFQKYLQYIPDSNYKFKCIQRVFDGALLRQVFEYYIYIG